MVGVHRVTDDDVRVFTRWRTGRVWAVSFPKNVSVGVFTDPSSPPAPSCYGSNELSCAKAGRTLLCGGGRKGDTDRESERVVRPTKVTVREIRVWRPEACFLSFSSLTSITRASPPLPTSLITIDEASPEAAPQLRAFSSSGQILSNGNQLLPGSATAAAER